MSQKNFYIALFFCAILAVLAAPFPHIAMWLGFSFAAYSVIANDSIQTLGTFLAANKKRSAWTIWLFVAGLLIVTTLVSWTQHTGDVTFERLTSKGFEQAPLSFSALQIMAPLFLLLLTRFAIPVSTTFLILSAFATSATSIYAVLQKSVSGYFLAFAASLALWLISSEWMRRLEMKPAAKFWYPLQWITSGTLWSIWIMQDAANVAVYLPRQLGVGQLIVYLLILSCTLAFLLYNRGGEIQKVVEEKTDMEDIRQATLIDLVYAGVLYYFKVLSAIPMSTTWVFIGLLAGREMGIKLRQARPRDWRATRKLIGKDLARVSLGLFVSVILAICINPVIRAELMGLF
jgi:hypothetical protein